MQDIELFPKFIKNIVIHWYSPVVQKFNSNIIQDNISLVIDINDCENFGKIMIDFIGFAELLHVYLLFIGDQKLIIIDQICKKTKGNFKIIIWFE